MADCGNPYVIFPGFRFAMLRRRWYRRSSSRYGRVGQARRTTFAWLGEDAVAGDLASGPREAPAPRGAEREAGRSARRAPWRQQGAQARRAAGDAALQGRAGLGIAWRYRLGALGGLYGGGACARAQGGRTCLFRAALERRAREPRVRRLRPDEAALLRLAHGAVAEAPRAAHLDAHRWHAGDTRRRHAASERGGRGASGLRARGTDSPGPAGGAGRRLLRARHRRDGGGSRLGAGARRREDGGARRGGGGALDHLRADGSLANRRGGPVAERPGCACEGGAGGAGARGSQSARRGLRHSHRAVARGGRGASAGGRAHRDGVHGEGVRRALGRCGIGTGATAGAVLEHRAPEPVAAPTRLA